MTDAKILTPAALITHATPFIDAANNLLAQANSAVIDSRESDAKAADAVKLCNARLRSLDESRRSLVDPLNAHVKWINTEFKKVAQTLEEAKRLISEKALAFKLAEEDRQGKEQEALRKEAEEQAIADAEAAQNAGDEERAEALLDMAASTPEGKTNVVARGDYTGASSSIKRDWKGEVVDIQEVCRGIADGKVPTSLIKEFSKTELNAFAKSIGKESRVFGIKIEHKPSLSTK